MRLLSLFGLCLILAVGLAASGEPAPPDCSLTLQLTDGAGGPALAGLVQLRDQAGQLVPLPDLLARGFGLEAGPAIHDWWVLPGAATVQVPAGKLTLRAFAGLETDVAELALDLTGKRHARAEAPLSRFYNAAERGYRSANTHLHLRKLSREQADRYLTEAPLADGLDVVFLSYLERAIEDLDYTSNKYTKSELDHLSQHGAKLGNGEEHRHNFTEQGQGYGHVMLLNIPELIQPVSIGPGITKQGTDGLPLRPGIEKAREFGSKVIWCHNDWGLEDIPGWLGGRLHANNIFDGGTHGSYKHSFYRYLNAGLRVPFSTGTDWFMYDFSRVYVPSAGPLTPEAWLDVLAQGQSTITNGPLLEFTVNGRGPGQAVELAAPGDLTIEASALGRVDFQRLELVRNGVVARTSDTRAEAGHFRADLQCRLSIDAPCWLALRSPPPPVADDPELQAPVPKNEYGCDLFAHTSAVYVRLAGRDHFDIAAAESLLAEMRESRHFIDEHARFGDRDERDRVLAVYDEGIAELTGRIAGNKKLQESGG